MRVNFLLPMISLSMMSLFANAQTVPVAPPVYLDLCDAKYGWNSQNELSINLSDKKQGTAALQATGNKMLEFVKVFPTYKSGATVETGAIKFWYYVSDVSKLTKNNQLELTSSGHADENEYNWDIGPLKNGWNLITKTFKSANITNGEPDLNAINFIRIYHEKTGSITTMIDGIEIIK